MRLKQLLGVVLLLLAGGSVFAAAGSQLTDVNVASHGAVTTLTFHINGTFTHNEYRPTDNLLLVDLAGVTPANFANATKEFHAPGVQSYHVNSYKGVSGSEVTRVEVTLLPGAIVKIDNIDGGIAVGVTGTAPEPATVAAAKPSQPAPSMPAARPAVIAEPASMPMGRPVTVEHVGVARSRDGVDIEILGSGVLTAKTMKLTQPDRVVIDLLNAVPATKSQQMAVNAGDVKAVRMARYQVKPPVTRVVVDLAGAAEYDVVPSGRRVTLKFHSTPAAMHPAPSMPIEPSVVAKSVPPTPVAIAPTHTAATPVLAAAPMPAAGAPAAAPAAPVKMAAAPPQTKAQDFVMVEAKYEPKGDGASEMNPAIASNMAMGTSVTAIPAAARMNAPVAVEAGSVTTFGTSAALSKSEQAASAQAGQQPGMTTSTSTRPRYTGEPISVNLKDVDLKDFFRLIHDISGFNIVIDPNVHGTLTLVLDDVPWDQALDIVLQNNGLDKQVTGNVLRIATVGTLTAEAGALLAKQKAEQLAVAPVTYTHYLSYAHATEVLPTIQKFLSERGTIIADARMNGLIIQDIPSVIPRVQQLLVQLDRKTQEVEIEARVVSAGRSFARDIGTELGFGWGNSTTAVGGAAGPSPITNNVPKSPMYIMQGGAIPLFSNMAGGATSGLAFTNATNVYRLDFVLTLAESRGLAKVLSRPRIVTQNNGQAVIRQGSQIPAVTPGTGLTNATVTYTAAFLTLTVTPQITAEGTIFLNVNVENTTPDFSHAVSGNPALNTQAATTSVLVADGGTVVLGGVISTVNSLQVQQVPILGNIPYIGNLFKRTTVSTSTQELIFFITPRIVPT